MYKYKIESNILITRNICSLVIRANSLKDVFSFKPGQYVAMSFRSEGRESPVRCFSIASAPSQKGLLEFGIRVGGSFTGELAKLKPGTEISVMGPYGNLSLDPRRVSQAVLIAGGIGVTPFMSMAREAVARKWPTKITLLYGSRNGPETAYAQELVSLSQNNSNFKPFFFLSDEPKISHNDIIINGTINAEQIGKILAGDFKNKSFYLCGPPGFMAAMRKILLAKEVFPEKIISEEFGLASFGTNTNQVQSKINSYVLAAVLTCFIAVGAGDIVKTNAKSANINQLAQNGQAIIDPLSVNLNSTPVATPKITPRALINKIITPNKPVPVKTIQTRSTQAPILRPMPWPTPTQAPVRIIAPVTSVS